MDDGGNEGRRLRAPIGLTVVGVAGAVLAGGLLYGVHEPVAFMTTGILIIVTVLSALIASNGRALIAGALLTFCLLICSLSGWLFALGASVGERAMTPVPRPTLEPIGTDPMYLRHPTDGWVIGDPGADWAETATNGLAAAARFARTMDGYWEWTNVETSAQVIVVSSRRAAGDENGAAFDHGLVVGAVTRALGANGHPDDMETGWIDIEGESAATIRHLTYFDATATERRSLHVIVIHHPDDDFDAFLSRAHVPGAPWFGPGSALPGWAARADRLVDARRIHALRGTSFTLSAPMGEPSPANETFARVTYSSPIGDMPAYFATPAGASNGAVLWLHGGFEVGGEIEPGWGPAILVESGVTVLVPALRGQLGSPGNYEVMLGEVNDARAALAELARRANVAERDIVVVGHSTGATLALLLAELGIEARAFVCFGPMAEVTGFMDPDMPPVPFTLRDPAEIWVRSPLHFAAGVVTPTILIEGADSPLADDAWRIQRAGPTWLPMRVIVEPGDHFTLVVPYTQRIAAAIAHEGPIL